MIEKNTLKSPAGHDRRVPSSPILETYESRRGPGHRMIGEFAENPPLQIAKKPLTRPQAKNSLASSSRDLHLIEYSNVISEHKKFIIGPKWI